MTLYQQLLLLIGLGVYTASSMSANLTLDGESEHFQYLKPTGANRDLTLNAPGTTAGVASIQGLWYIIRCDPTASYSIVVKSGVTTLVTLAAGDWAIVACGGANGSATWKVMASSAGLATLTLTGALSAASAAITGALTAQSAAFTGALTTTEGVSGGTARKVGGILHSKQDTTTVSNTITESNFGSHTLEASLIKLGTTLEIVGTVRVTGVTGSPTLNLKLYCGSTVLDQTTAVTVAANDYYHFRFTLVGQAAASAASAVSSNGVVLSKIAGVKGTNVVTGSPGNMATNGTLTVRLTGTWGTASLSNVAACDDFLIKATA